MKAVKAIFLGTITIMAEFMLGFSIIFTSSAMYDKTWIIPQIFMFCISLGWLVMMWLANKEFFYEVMDEEDLDNPTE